MSLNISHCQAVSSDGSDRRFLRGHMNGRSVILIHPAPGMRGVAEAHSYFQIGRHLKTAGVNVPEIFHFDRRDGTLVVDDLGTEYFQTAVLRHIDAADFRKVESLYREALSLLAEMQVRAGIGFNPSWCYDTGLYDSLLAFEREALYFGDNFLVRLMRKSVEPYLAEDFKSLASRIDMIKKRDFFLHRDFQSRNILVKNGKLGVIDFQGGRLGPLAYDAASLLFDPYVPLPASMREALFDSYVESLRSLGASVEEGAFAGEFRLLAVFRILQALGAYAYLSLVKGKVFFSRHIPRALENLKNLVRHDDFQDLEHLCLMIKALRIS